MATIETAQLAARKLRAVSKRVRVLKSLSWPEQVAHDFFANGENKLPNLEYPKLDQHSICGELDNIRKLIHGDNIIYAWLNRITDSLDVSAHMLASAGTQDFLKFSARLYGTPDKLLLDGRTKTLDLAQHMDGILSGFEEANLQLLKTSDVMNSEEFAKRLAMKIHKYFGDASPKVLVTEHLSAKAVAGRTRIRIRKSASFNSLDLRQLLHHEALVHTATSINGYEQDDFPILASSHAGTTETQEGLAVFAEFITGSMDPARFRRLVDRVIAIDMAIKGADFIEVYRYFKNNGIKKEQAFENTRRVFRGGVLHGGAPFTKDIVYLNGLLRVHNFLRTAIKLGRGDLVRLLFVGKLDIEDIPSLATLAANGFIKPAKILPPWASDMRFLVSYLAYSSFLNRVKLPGFQNYYASMLKDVPNLWEFGSTSSG